MRTPWLGKLVSRLDKLKTSLLPVRSRKLHDRVMSDSNYTIDRFLLKNAYKVVLIYKLLSLSTVGVGSNKVLHRHVLWPTNPQRPHLLFMGIIKDSATVSCSDGILPINDADGWLFRVDLDDHPRSCTNSGSSTSFAVAGAPKMISSKRRFLCNEVSRVYDSATA